MGHVKEIEAAPWTALPQALHYKGPPNDWVKMTRPGQSLHSFLEGPSFNDDGQLWLADIPYGRLLRVDASGSWSLAYSYDGEPHGLCWLPDGTLLIADYRQGLLQFNPADQSLKTLCTKSAAGSFYGIADLCRGEDGSIWITDPGRSSLSDPYGRVYRYHMGSEAADVAIDHVPYPNSVALSPDGKNVYVSVTRANAVWRFLAAKPETYPPMVGVHVQLSGGLGPDGLAMRKDGIWAVAQAQAGCVYVFDPIGHPLARISLPGGLWTTAVRFSPDEQHLIVVEAQDGALYRINMTDIH